MNVCISLSVCLLFQVDKIMNQAKAALLERNYEVQNMKKQIKNDQMWNSYHGMLFGSPPLPQHSQLPEDINSHKQHINKWEKIQCT